MVGVVADPTKISSYIANAMKGLRGLGVKAWFPFAFETDARYYNVDGRIVLPSTEVVSGNGSVFNRGRILTASIANRLRVSRGFSGVGQVGALIEPARTELLSDGKTEFNVATTGWTNSGTPVYTANTDVAPDGTTTADSLEDDSSSAFEAVFQSITVAADTVIRAASVFIKKTTSATTFPALAINYFPTNRFTNLVLDTNTGIVTVAAQTGGAATVGVSSFGDYWRIFVAKANSDSNTEFRISLYPALSTDGTTQSVTATGTNVFWGAQVEVGTFPSSYIFPAVGTRAAEDLRYDNTNEEIMEGAAGTIIFVATPDFDSTETGNRTLIDTRSTVGDNDGLRWRWSGGDTAFEALFRSGGATSAILLSTSTPVRGKPGVCSAAWDTNDFRLVMNGVEEASDISGAAPVTMDNDFFVGEDIAGVLQFGGLIAHILTFNRALTLRQQNDVVKTYIQPIYPGRLRMKT